MGGRGGGRAMAAHEVDDKSAPEQATTLLQVIQGRSVALLGSRGVLFRDMACQDSRPWMRVRWRFETLHVQARWRQGLVETVLGLA